jgi:hypothetical protein
VSIALAHARLKVLLFPLILTSALLASKSSRAGDPSSPPPDDPERVPPPRIVEGPNAEDDPPPKSTATEPSATRHRSRLDVSASLGYAAPSGNATGAAGDNLTASFSGQFPIGFQIGGDVTPALFVGAYGTFAPGGVGSAVNSTCQTGALDCSSISFHGGVTVEYRFNVPESFQPWIGYGFGYETNSLSESSSSGQTGWLTASGWELGRFRAGVDFLPASIVGLGIFGEVSLGQYDHIEGQSGQGLLYDGDVPQKALHEWLSLGIRVRIMP